MEYFKLNDGNTLPALGFGTYQATEEEGIESVKVALEKGYRLLDSASRYENEEAVGKGIKASGIAREEIIVTTKIWRDTLGYENTRTELETSLQKLGLDYLDLYLIHWPANAKNYANWQEVNSETWRAMEDLQTEGKIKSIGVSNFWQEHLEPLLATARVIPAINQLEFHPGYWQQEEVEFSKRNGILVQAWSPFARGKIFDNEVLKAIAKKHGKSVSQITLRWCLEHETLPIPKSTTASRIQENLDIFDFTLSASEIEKINQIPRMGFSGEYPNEWPDRIFDEEE